MSMPFTGGSAPFDPLTDLPGLLWLVHTDDCPVVHTLTGPFGACTFTKSGTEVTLTDPGVVFPVEVVNETVTITGSTTAANNGTFLVTTRIGATQIRYTNAAGVTEAFPGVWRLNGRGDSCIDRVATYTLTQANRVNKFGLNPAIKPGHRVFETLTSNPRKWYALNNAALAGNLTGSPPLTLGMYARFEGSSSGATNLFGHLNAQTGPTAAVRFQRAALAGPSVQLDLVDDTTGTDTTYSTTSPTTGAWALWSVTYDGAGSAKFYRDGTLLATVAGVDRTGSALTWVLIGELAASTTARPMYTGGFYACTGELSAADLGLFGTWFAGTFI
jgi:hypothetical protein